MIDLGELNRQGIASADRGDLSAAEALFAQAVRQNSNDIFSLSNWGSVLNAQGNYFSALEVCERLRALSPNDPIVFCHHGGVLKAMGDLDAAVRVYRLGLEKDPRCWRLWSDYLLALNFLSLDTVEVITEHRRFGRLFEAGLTPYRHFVETKPQKLRIGFVSSDFNKHAAAAFALPLFVDRETDQMEFFVYDNGSRVDFIHHQFRLRAKAWRDISRLEDDQAAELIYRDQLHALIDLSGHTRGHRLGVFARKPAPLQVSWFGYMNTTGLEAMDLRFAHPLILPPTLAELYPEKSVYLKSPWPHRVLDFSAVTGAGPHAAEQLRADRAMDRPLTFGSLNNFSKVHAEVVRAWAQILRARTEAEIRIVIPGDERFRESRRRWLCELGLPAERLTVLPEQNYESYLQRLREIDILLDPFPYGGGVTTADALAMGVHVLTQLGARETGRMSAAFLMQAGLEDWIARSTEDYIERGLRLSKDLTRLRAQKSDLAARAQWKASDWAAEMESALRSQLEERFSTRRVRPVRKSEIEEVVRWHRSGSGPGDWQELSLSEAYGLFRRLLQLRLAWRIERALPLRFADGVEKSDYSMGSPLLQILRELREWIVVRSRGLSREALLHQVNLYPQDELADFLAATNAPGVWQAVEQIELQQLLADLEAGTSRSVEGPHAY